MRDISVIEFIEVYAYSSLLLIFAYLIAMAVIGMAYGSETQQERNSSTNEPIQLFYILYMTSILVVPVSCTLG